MLFLDIAMPSNLSRKQIIERYDNNSGFPTDAMVVEMKAAVKKIEAMKTYEDWFNVRHCTLKIIVSAWVFVEE